MKKIRLVLITLLLSFMFFPSVKRYFAEDMSPFLDPMALFYFWLVYLAVTFLWILRVTVDFARRGFLGASAHSVISAVTFGSAAYFSLEFIFDGGGMIWFFLLLLPLLAFEVVDLKRSWMAAFGEDDVTESIGS